MSLKFAFFRRKYTPTRNGSDFANPPAGFTENFDDVDGILTVVAQ